MAAGDPKLNIFVVGQDEFHFDLLKTIRRAERYAFHDLLSYADIVRAESYDLERLLSRAFDRLRSFPGKVDAIIGYWDFPTSLMLPLLRKPCGLPGPTLEAVLKCEHKYWSRQQQAAVVPEHTPRFFAVDPHDDQARQKIALDYPFWMKPVKAHSSYLCFKIRNDREFREAIERTRRGITLFAAAIDGVMRRADLPPDIAAVDGRHCIAEAVISAGQQCTLEGYVLDGAVTIYGAVDSIRAGKHRSSFARYQYPSRMSRSVQQRMAAAAQKVVRHVGLDRSPFNIEFFYDRETDRISLLEINARISKSHAPLFLSVDGASHQQVPVEVALGERPALPRREGRFRHAAKFMLRHFGGDAVVRRAPRIEDVDRLRADFPGLQIRLHVREGMRLSDMTLQEPYSYELADIFLSGGDPQGLGETYRRLLPHLPIELDEPAAA